jgi:hypothetical protein
MVAPHLDALFETSALRRWPTSSTSSSTTARMDASASVIERHLARDPRIRLIRQANARVARLYGRLSRGGSLPPFISRRRRSARPRYAADHG